MEIKYGDLVKVKENFERSGKVVAKIGDVGKVVAFNGSYEGKTSIRLNRKRYAILDFPVNNLSILTSTPTQC